MSAANTLSLPLKFRRVAALLPLNPHLRREKRPGEAARLEKLLLLLLQLRPPRSKGSESMLLEANTVAKNVNDYVSYHMCEPLTEVVYSSTYQIFQVFAYGLNSREPLVKKNKEDELNLQELFVCYGVYQSSLKNPKKEKKKKMFPQ